MGNPLQGHTNSVYSVAFPPDGRHIVLGSWDQTIQVFHGHLTDQVPKPLNSLTGPTSSSWQSLSIPPIHFSSQGVHALQNPQSFFMNTCSTLTKDCRDLVHLQQDGWIVGPSGHLLLWVPPSYRLIAFYSPWTRLVIPKGIPELDLSKMVHGTTWHECYSPK